MSRITSTVSLFMFSLLCCSSLCADEMKTLEKEKAEVQKVALTADGKLVGKVFAVEEKDQSLTNAKLTLSADGVVIDTVQADAEGNFSFANVAPGSYQMFGYANGLVGSSSVAVMPFNSQAVSDVNVGLAQPDMGYDVYAGAPVQSFGDASCGSACGAGSCGGGGGGLNRRRLLLLTGAALGITAIAGGFDGKDDASPTN